MIPTYEEIMLPLFKYLSDGEEHNLSQTHDDLATQLKLTDEELRELLPSGKKQFLEIESHGPELTW